MNKKQLSASTQYLEEKGFLNPEIGIVLGSGLGRMVDEIQDARVAHYHHIPYFPLATVEFHSGILVYGNIEGR